MTTAWTTRRRQRRKTARIGEDAQDRRGRDEVVRELVTLTRSLIATHVVGESRFTTPAKPAQPPGERFSRSGWTFPRAWR
jgi:hypothetical protein